MKTRILNYLLAFLGICAVACGIFAPETVGMTGEHVLTANVGAGTILVADVMRANFRRVWNFISGQSWYNPSSPPNIYEADLRMEKALDSSKSTITFDPGEARGGQDRDLESKISTNEAFFICAWALGIHQQDVSGDYADGNAANPIYTFPDPNFFTTAGSALESLYQGKLRFKTDNTTRIDDFLTHNLRYVPEKVLEASSTTSANDTPPKYGPGIEERGYYYMNPAHLIDGNRDNSFELELGETDRSNIAGSGSSAQNYAVLLIKGFRIEGVSIPSDRTFIHV